MLIFTVAEFENIIITAIIIHYCLPVTSPLSANLKNVQIKFVTVNKYNNNDVFYLFWVHRHFYICHLKEENLLLLLFKIKFTN